MFYIIILKSNKIIFRFVSIAKFLSLVDYPYHAIINYTDIYYI